MISPKISVVTASFNAERFLHQCLGSVREQQNSNTALEHIVIDGASTDGTLQILKNWPSASPRPLVPIQNSASNIQHSRYSFEYLSEPDQGQSDAFNKGVAMAKGDWICWLNADDMLASEAISAFQKALIANPKADVIYGHVQFIDEESLPVKVSYHLPYFYSLILNGCYIPPSSGTFFRRDFLLRQPLDIDYHFVMDVEWFLRCGRGLKAVLVDQVFSHFRISADAKTSEMIRSGQITDRHREERETYRRKHVYSQWPGLNEEQARKKFERRQWFFLLIYKAMKMRYALRYLKDRKG